MKIALCGDVHWSQYSSIVRKRGEKYSIRLENLIKSVNWFNDLSKSNNCVANFYLGDFFDKSDLNAEECAALSDIVWSNCKQYFLCGNHEMQSVNHNYSSAKVFNLLDVGEVIDKPKIINFDKFSVYALPYILENDRKPIKEYFTEHLNTNNVLISHNDISGVQMGRFISESGFSIDEFESISNLTINGHLHNCGMVSNKVLNIGILSGMNFSEDAAKYQHNVMIIDTDTLKVDVYENPYAFNFYKIDVSEKNTFNFNSLKTNAVITVKCNSNNIENIKLKINENKGNIIESHIVVQPIKTECSNDVNIDELTVDHLDTFKSYILSNFENTKELIEELTEVIK